MHGVEKLKGAISLGINLAEGLDKRLDDGKLSFIEGITLIPTLKDLPEVVKSFSKIKEEWKDLDEAEQGELVDFIKDELELDSVQTEALIESALDAVLALGKLIYKIKEVKK